MAAKVQFALDANVNGLALYRVTTEGPYRGHLFASSHALVGDTGTVLPASSGSRKEIWIRRRNGEKEPVNGSFPLYRPEERDYIPGAGKGIGDESAKTPKLSFMSQQPRAAA